MRSISTRFAVFLCCLSLALLVITAQAQTPAGNPPRLLERDKPIEDSLAGGQSHTYQISLAANQLLDLVVEQRGVDVELILSLNDQTLLTIDSPNGTKGIEPILFVSHDAGDYRLLVRVPDAKAKAGQYQIKLRKLQPASTADRATADAFKLHYAAVALVGQKKFAEAATMEEAALKRMEQEVGPDSPQLAGYVKSLADIHTRGSAFAQAKPLYQRFLALQEKALAQKPADLGDWVWRIASIHHDQSAYDEAETLYQRAIKLLTDNLGEGHPRTLNPLNDLGTLYLARGNYPKAEEYLQRVVAMRQKMAPEDTHTAGSMINLAVVFLKQGEYIKAEDYYRQAQRIWEKLGSNNVLYTLNGLALIQFEKGDYEQAETLYQKSLALAQKTYGPDSQQAAITFGNMSAIYYRIGDDDKAEQMFTQALEMRKKAFGPEHFEVAIILNWLARTHARKGNAEKAQQLYQQALDILKKSFGTESPHIAFSLNDLGSLAMNNGAYEKAEGFYQEALKIRERLVGKNNLDVSEVLSNLAWLARAQGEPQKAIQYQLQANEINESRLRINLTVGSEKQKLKYLTLFANTVNDTLVLQTQTAPADKTALNMALEMLLRSKGRGLEAMSNSFATLRQRANPEEKILFDNLLTKRSQLANLSLRGLAGERPEIYRAQLKQLEDETGRLEDELSRRSPTFRTELQPVTLASVQAALPAEAALIEFITYQPYDQSKKAYTAPHYLAYALNAKGDINWKDLGDAAPIDQLIASFRESLQDERRKDAAPLARKLEAKVMQPVRALVRDAKHLLVSPDGALNLIPFAALMDENKRYLVEQYQFTYLTSGRDLLRLQTQASSSESPVIVADPDFGQQLAGEATRSSASVLANTTFTPLPGTAAEAQAIKTILPRAELLTKNNATEAALKQLNAPSILHIATHGFFLADTTASNQTRGQRKLLQTAAPNSLSDKDIVMSNPLLRSGLGLAGANRARQGGEDGILTAMEAASLNLHGTKLVVLSACDTGVGEVKNGDGVHGLRRALVLAGAETQVMSLWPVSDQGTRDLMTQYYKALQTGAGRSAALRQVQLSLRKRKDRQHPFYWASFIVSGEWSDLKGNR